jgi:catechol 2,3-dioxygenase-like lactoylglutathione lyase family enzyme
VTDLEASLSFYRDKLGFTAEFVYDGFYASVVRDGCHIHLKRASPLPRDQAAFERDENLDACIIVANALHLSLAMTDSGAQFSVPLREMPYGSEFYVRDPDGYVLGFVQPVEAA